MPKIDPKVIQDELKKGIFWPVYWLYGSEQMKARELFKRIRVSLLGEEEANAFSLELIDGSSMSAHEVVDRANSLSFGGGAKLIFVRDGDDLKDIEALESLFTDPKSKSETQSVVVLLSDSLDQRKKWVKTLTEKAAVVGCEEVAETDREAWIRYLAKRRELTPPEEWIMEWLALEPWSLDLIDQELEKWSLNENSLDEVGENAYLGKPERFLDAFFSRNKSLALKELTDWVEDPQVTLPFLGLVAWNVRQLLVMKRASIKLGPHMLRRLEKWYKRWEQHELVALEKNIFEIDFKSKQTRALPRGLWSELVFRHLY